MRYLQKKPDPSLTEINKTTWASGKDVHWLSQQRVHLELPVLASSIGDLNS